MDDFVWTSLASAVVWCVEVQVRSHRCRTLADREACSGSNPSGDFASLDLSSDMTDLDLPEVDADPPSGSLAGASMVSSLGVSTGTLGCLPAVADLESADSATHAASGPCESSLRVLRFFGRARWSEYPLPMLVHPELTVSCRRDKALCRPAALHDRDAPDDPRWPTWAQSGPNEHETMSTDLWEFAQWEK